MSAKISFDVVVGDTFNAVLHANDVITLNRRMDDLADTVSMYELPLSEKREEIALLNQEQKRLDNLVTHNNGNNNNYNDTEVIHASGDWHNVIS